jgi:uncharacterized protein (TIGR03437 family)
MRINAILAGLLIALSPHAVLRAQGAPAATTGWYNGDWREAIPGQGNWYVSDAAFGRTYDDFVVPNGGWTVAGVFSNNSIYTSAAITEASWEIRGGMAANNGGTLIASGRGHATQTVIGAVGNGVYVYRIEVDGLQVHLAAGMYWLSVTPVAAGENQAYVCATLGANAVGNPPGNDGKAFYHDPGAADFIVAQTSGQYGTSGDFSQGVLISTVPAVPAIAAVVSAASFQGGSVSPGEVVTIGGTAIGPGTPAYLTLDQNGNVSTTLGGVQVLFGGVPAPLIYVSSTQINAVVPYEFARTTNPSAQVAFGGQTSSAFPLSLAASAPAMFTFNGSGTGPAAILNQDNSYNTPTNPATKGSYVVVYVTGEGQTNPGGVTGKVTTISPAPPLTPQPSLPVSVSIGGQPAVVAFYGEAPGVVSGVMQLNVQIPANAASGNVPIAVTVGGNSSQSAVTVSVQ